MSYFNTAEAARRYDKFRPQVHNQLIREFQSICRQKSFNRAIDLACGTGHSTIPLKDLSDHVLGLDSSAAMLDFAKQKGIDTIRAEIPNFTPNERFDLISSCMAFHWLPPEETLEFLKQISKSKAIWFIYNFSFLGHFSNEEFNQWYRKEYFKKFPSPARNKQEANWESKDPEIQLIEKSSGSIPLRFNLEQLIGYLCTQSNIAAYVDEGKSYESAERTIREDLKGISLEGNFEYKYSFEIYKFQRKTA